MVRSRSRGGRFECRNLQRIHSTFALLLLISAGASSGRAEPNSLPNLHLNVIVTDRLTPGADAGEIAAASAIWIKSLGFDQGLAVDSKVQVSSSVEAIRKEVDTSKVDLLTASALDYLNVDRGNLEPVMTMSPSENPKGKIQYLLLTSRDSGLSTIESLKDKTVLTYSHSDQALLRMWTDVFLGSRHLPSSANYFHAISATLKPSTACLPVFFGKAEACVIDDATWSVLKELNSQLGAKLRPIAESPYLIETVVALNVDTKQYRAEILRGMQSLQDTPAGRQLLVFFKSRRAYKINRDDLAEVIEMRKAYLKLEASGDRKSPHSHANAPTASGAIQKD